MDEIKLISGVFSDSDRKEFRQFIHRSRFREARKDLTLFNQIIDEKKIKKRPTIESTNRVKNQNAYHSTRKRLVKHLHDFIYHKNVVGEESSEALITKNLVLIKSFFNHGLNELAWKYLLRTENQARKAEMNQKLVEIYDFQIVHYDQIHVAHSLDELISLRLKSSTYAQEEERLRIVGSLVKQELQKIKLQGQDLDLQKLIGDLLVRFDLDDTIFNRPRLLYEFVLLTRNVVLAEKTFYSFENFVVRSCKRLEKSKFAENNPTEYLTILYYVCHTLYRNRKFKLALDYLDILESKTELLNKTQRTNFTIRLLMMQAACMNFIGRLNESILLLDSVLTIEHIPLPDLLNAKLNLAIYHFEKKDYKKANKALISIGYTDKRCEKLMGVEWILKKNLIDIFFQYELGRPEIAYDRLVSLQRTHHVLIQTRKYERVGIFLKLVSEIINHPEQVHSPEFAQRVEHSFVWVDIKEEDIQAISYYAWLKSKMIKRDFYHVLLDLIHTPESA